PFDVELCTMDSPSRERPSPSMTPLPTSLPSEPDISLNEDNLNAFNWASQSLQWLQDQGYSLEQAIAFLLYKEASLTFDGKHMLTTVLNAITYKYNQYCSAGAGTASCLRGFWSYYQPMQNLWNSSLLQGGDNGGIKWFFNDYSKNLAYVSEARQVIGRPELGGEANNKPSGWASVGSVTNQTTYGLLENATVGSLQNQVFYKAKPYPYDGQMWLFVVLSVDQQNYHCGGSCVSAP
ncbi:MAG: hypothetical protein KC413_17965, partial [Anaerolineales bacterium]|nr:hypothetical protein [Anaerolineales bacterium]